MADSDSIKEILNQATVQAATVVRDTDTGSWLSSRSRGAPEAQAPQPQS